MISSVYKKGIRSKSIYINNPSPSLTGVFGVNAANSVLNLSNAGVEAKTLLLAVSRARVTGSNPDVPRAIRAVGAGSETASIGKVKVASLVNLPTLCLECLGKLVVGDGGILKNTLSCIALDTIQLRVRRK
jgi:hypothetical protein